MSQKKKVAKPVTFDAWLPEVRRGDLVTELNEKLAEVVREVTLLEKPGTLTLKLTIVSDEMGTVRIVDDVTTKIPQPKRKTTVWFVGESYDLTRSNPAQRSIDDEVELAKGNITADDLPAQGEAKGEIPMEPTPVDD